VGGGVPRFRRLPFEEYGPELCAEDFGPLGAPHGRPDLVFMSPPFYNWEVYGDDPGQSYQSQSFASWRDLWLFPAAEKAWALLAPGGHLAVYLSDVRGVPLVRDFLARLRPTCGEPACLNCRRGTKRSLPLWVWRKPPALAERAAPPPLSPSAPAYRAPAPPSPPFPRPGEKAAPEAALRALSPPHGASLEVQAGA
jgi:hypothetical protein